MNATARPAAHTGRIAAPGGPGDLRTLMAAFPTGVAVVAAYDAEGAPFGMTCSSLCSVALEPPTLLVCLRESGPTAGAVLASGAFTVNLLDGDSRAVAELFASGDPERFARVDWKAGGAGPHLAADAHSTADCRVSSTYSIGDHVVVLGEVAAVTAHREPRPLLYGMRRFKTWEGAESCMDSEHSCPDSGARRKHSNHNTEN